MSAAAHALAAGWPVALMVGALAVWDRARTAHRLVAIDRALHELRRPLQALALFPRGTGSGSGTGPATVELALAALDDLDREVNGGEPASRLRPVPCRSCVQAAVQRWRAAAVRPGDAVELRWLAGGATVLADPRRLAQAIDNLVANSLEHASPPVTVEGTVAAGRVRIAVRDGGTVRASAGAAAARTAVVGLGVVRLRRRDRRRRGHGLGVVSRIAAEHGGRFVLSRGDRGVVATLELPLAGAAEPSVAVRAA